MLYIGAAEPFRVQFTMDRDGGKLWGKLPRIEATAECHLRIERNDEAPRPILLQVFEDTGVFTYL